MSNRFARPGSVWHPRAIGARTATHEAGHILAGHLWLRVLPLECTIVRSTERRGGCLWPPALDHNQPPQKNWGRIPLIAQPRLENILRMLVACAVSTQLLGRDPGRWWTEDRYRATEYAKWLEGEDERRQRRRVRLAMSEVRAAFGNPRNLASLEALSAVILAERTVSSARLTEIMATDQAETC